MKFHRKNFFIVTGAPGVGKTSLIESLGKDFSVESEPAREVIAEQRATNGSGLWENDRKLFIDLLLTRSLEKYSQYSQQQIVLFDRGIPDNIAYANSGAINNTDYVKASQDYRYNKYVFLLNPWEKIYGTDDERNMTFQEVEKFHQQIIKVYRELDYMFIEVPNGDVAERTSFVENHLVNLQSGEW